MEPIDPVLAAPPRSSRGGRVLLITVMALGLALLLSPALYLLVGLLGTVVGLPLGALSWTIVWAGLVGGVFAVAPWTQGMGQTLLAFGGISALDTEKRSQVLWVISLALLLAAASLTYVLWPGSATATADLRWCYAGDLARGAAGVAAGAMGHGRAPAPIACGAVPAPDLLRWLPLIVAAAFVLLVRRAHAEQEDRERNADAVAQRRVFEARRAAASAVVDSGPPAGVTAMPVDAPAVESLVLPEAAPVSARTAALLQARRQAARRREPIPTDWLLPLKRWPVLSAGLLCYLSGWALELGGSDLPTRIASSLAPAMLRYSLHGWPVLGLWVSGWVALVVGAFAMWVRKVNEE